MVELFVFCGFGHAGLGVVADGVHFGAGDGDNEVGLSDLGGGAGWEVGDIGATEEGFSLVSLQPLPDPPQTWGGNYWRGFAVSP